MTNIENLLNEVLTIKEGNKLQQKYKDIFISKCSEYESIEEIAEGIDNGDFYCQNGNIGALLYYYQTKEIFKNYYEEVLGMTQEYFEIYGYNNDIELNSNNLVWLTFEFMVIGWYYDIKEYIYEVKEGLYSPF